MEYDKFELIEHAHGVLVMNVTKTIDQLRGLMLDPNARCSVHNHATLDILTDNGESLLTETIPGKNAILHFLKVIRDEISYDPEKLLCDESLIETIDKLTAIVQVSQEDSRVGTMDLDTDTGLGENNKQKRRN